MNDRFYKIRYEDGTFSPGGSYPCKSKFGKVWATAGDMEYTEEQVLKAIYESGLHQYIPGVIRSSWKDGIDIDIPHSSLMNFVRKLTKKA